MTSPAPSQAALSGGRTTAPEEKGRAKEGHPSGTHSVAGRPKILVVDDDEDVREALDSALAEEGYDVFLARDGLEALSSLRERFVPELIVLDLTMPRMNGAEFRRRVRAELPQLRRVPLVVMSADLEGRERARELGAAAFLRKPVRLAELLRTVSEELQRVEQA